MATTKKKRPAKAPSPAKKPKTAPRRAAAASSRVGAKKPTAARPKKKAGKAAAKAGSAPLPRRAVFIDVENTSNEDALAKVIDGLKIDRTQQATELYAFGNWRAVGQTMSRHLARLGATLVHTSPVTGVKDWSDLWIAVAAGRWIALAAPGDVLEIVSNDKAFEAVGDAAANAGIVFRRVLHRASASSSSSSSAADAGDGAKPKRRRRRGGRGRRGGASRARAQASTSERSERPTSERSDRATSERSERPTSERRERSTSERSERPTRAAQRPAAKTEVPARREAANAGHDAEVADGHGASHEHILAVIRRLTGNDPARWVNLDAIANALKTEGFTRPPGSPRLVVRLRRMKDIEVQPNGMVRVVG